MTTQDLLSAGSDSADAVWIRMMNWWAPGYKSQFQIPQTTMQLLFSPQLPPLLSPLPNLFRLISLLIVAPIVFFCLVDFAGYAVFRTLGFNRRRVRVKTKGVRRTGSKSNRSANRRAKLSAAPVLTPGAYDADALLRHRERSASAASAEAIEEWKRTGGNFARVSTIQARKTTLSTNTPTSPNSLTVPDAISPPDSPRDEFNRVQGVGVEGALGYIDTDAEDSGMESERNSPELGRKSFGSTRRGLSGSALEFTPVSSEAPKSLKLHVPYLAPTSSLSVDTSDRSPKSNDSITSSWIRLDESSNEEVGGMSASEVAA